MILNGSNICLPEKGECYDKKTWNDVGGQRVPHLAQQKVIQKIITLRKSEMSFRSIADYLNKNNTQQNLGANGKEVYKMKNGHDFSWPFYFSKL